MLSEWCEKKGISEMKTFTVPQQCLSLKTEPLLILVPINSGNHSPEIHVAKQGKGKSSDDRLAPGPRRMPAALAAKSAH